MKCHHYENCGAEAVYDFETVEDETIYVCAKCDELYTACEVCGKSGIWDAGYGNMSKFKENDDWPTCFRCQERED